VARKDGIDDKRPTLHAEDWQEAIKLMTDSPPQSPSEGIAHRLGGMDIVEALRAAGPDAYIAEQEAGCFVIDGHFDLVTATRMLCEKLDKHRS
jgi:hypothetical protein